MNTIIYLDNNATTMVAPEVLEAMLPFFTRRYGNPSSMHDFGGDVEHDMEKARNQVARMLGAEYDYEIVFTSGATESDNMAILGTLQYYRDKKHIITTKVEHPAVLNLCRQLEREGYSVTYVPVDREGNLDVDFLFDSVTDDTAIVSVMYANNETGVIFPVETIGAFCKQRGITFHIDAVQAIGKIPVDVNALQCDLLAISGHKFHAPKGIGVLYVRRGTRLRPLLYGGHQEKARRPGTHNVPGIVGIGKAAELVMQHLSNSEEVANVKRLRDRLENGLLSQLSNAHLNGNKNNRVDNTTNIGFEFIEGEAILLYLNEKGIAASSGSACSSGSLEPSHVLRAMGVTFTSAHGSIRFSLSRYTTEDEIQYTLQVMPEVVNRLLAISPYWDAMNKKGKSMTELAH
ncbi:MAG TPA: cysteine desulfurase NifS [Spirochaetota bacterium]|nr:cysteine desulfurase NifS [Spirochaetota bacterium]HOR94351.1 cysteine desulfurase NifS [Spirochaetota bacterium]HOT19326.1 cysteine desulfurase NifS [Spirochaetota bacterium]HPD05000.1 cysteine desulfurase NifS [Spirochaetota bacterium]HQG42265.1 cysteine desulfurase NifS [Spirochaetota bacterium]